jgi:hypothetical protein
VLLPVADLKPGQILAEDVTNENGMILCSAGFELTENAIARLKRAGISAAVVRGSTDPAVMERRLAEVRARFEGNGNPALTGIQRAIEQAIARILT